MNKAELSDKIAGDAGITKAEANKVIKIIAGNVVATLTKGNRVTIKGFGSFLVVSQSARNRRNPKTGEIVKVGATKKVKFIVGKKFRDEMLG